MAKINISGLPKTVQAAKESGSKYYYTDMPCKDGHLDARFTSTRTCMSCNRANRKKYRKIDLKKFREYDLMLYYKHHEKHKERGREYHRKNKEVLAKKAKEYKKNNKHKEREYKKYLYANDINFKIKTILRARLYYAIKNKSKKGSALKLLGCSIEEFIKHLESKFTEGMTWDNQGKWHLDHRFPLASFDLEDPQQLAKACHFSNIQPLWATDNHSKSAKILYDC